MNIGYAAFCIVLALTPGIFFREAYFSGPFSKRFIATRVLQDLASPLIYSAIIHLVFLNLVKRYDPLTVTHVINCVATDQYIAISKFTRDNAALIFNYFIFTNLWALWFGITAQKTVRFLKLDRYYPIFRFPNQWHYLTSAEVLDFPTRNSSKKYGLGSDVNDYILVDILTEICGLSYLYSGKLHTSTLGKDGTLETITMLHPYRMRRKHFDFFGAQEEYMMPIIGKYMVFKQENILNYNFTYLSVDETKKRWDIVLKRVHRYFLHPFIAFWILWLAWHQFHWLVAFMRAACTVFL